MTATDHSIWSLVMEASLLVKGVMLTLLLASVATWFLIAQRGRLFAQLLSELHAIEDARANRPEPRVRYRVNPDERAALEALGYF